MNRMKRKSLSIFLVILLIISITALPVFAATAQEKKDKLEEQLQDVKDEKKQVANQKSKIMEEIGELSSKISEYEAQITSLNKEINELKGSIAQKEEQITKLQKEFEEKEEALKVRLVAMYEAGQTTYMDVLLSSDSFTNFISNFYMMSELAEADKAVMNSIEEKKKQIDETKKELEKEKTKVASSKAQVEAKNKELNEAKSAKQSKVNSLSAEEKKLQSKIEEYEAAIKKADEEIKKALQQSSGYQGSFSGTLSWPLSTSSANYNLITSGYGRRDQPTSGASTNHKALDIGVSYQSVYAPADGYVVTASPVSGYGNFIMIKHSNSLYTCFGHLSSYNVSAGQTVKRGQKIAVSGNTGISTGPHLHFEVRTNGSSYSRVNPLNYISNDVYNSLRFW